MRPLANKSEKVSGKAQISGKAGDPPRKQGNKSKEIS
jgi:hypothetical protein